MRILSAARLVVACLSVPGDPSFAEDPVFLGQWPEARRSAGSVSEVAVSGTYAYLADNTEGLRIIDVSNPAAPVSMGRYRTTYAFGVAVSSDGDLAYVADGSAGLTIIDVSNASAPGLIGKLAAVGWATGVALSAKHVFVVGPEGFSVVDATNPATPVRVGTAPVTAARKVALAGNYAYVADTYGGFKIFDVSNPTAPRLVGTHPTRNSFGVAVSGSYAYIAAELSGLQILDVSNPSQPVRVGSYTGSLYRTLGVAVLGKHAYVASAGRDVLGAPYTGFHVIDVSNPAAPALVGKYDPPGDEAAGVTLAGDNAYVANGASGISILRIRQTGLEISQIGGRVVVSWSAANSTLLTSRTPDGSPWLPITEGIEMEGGRSFFTINPAQEATFYRLREQ